MDLFPIYRIEQFLDAIVSGTTPPEPVAPASVEFYLAKIAGADVQIPAFPISRVDHFLAKICGQNVPLPIPQGREERYLAKIAGEDVEIPPFPINRIDFWLAEWASGSGGQLVTVTGVSPLLLVNALAKPIRSLTQYGKCAQATTPAPSAPVDIMCNNGALKMVDDELPAAYKRVLGFTCDNNALWEITGFRLRGSDTVRVSFEIAAACNVFGCYQGTTANDNYDLYASTSSGSKYFRYGNGTYASYFSTSNQNKRFDVVYTPNGSQGMPEDSTWDPMTFTSANDLLIGSTTLTGSSAKLKGKLYGNFEVDGRLKLIPCERVSDGVLGYYDTYGATFYEPYEGFDGAVSLGYDGSHYHLQVVGSPEVLTVKQNLYDASARTDNYYLLNDGGQKGATGASYSGAIPVKGGKLYTFTGVSSKEGSNNKRIVAYSSDGTPSSSLHVGHAVSVAVEGIGVPYSVTINTSESQYANAKYIRFSFNTDDTNVVCFEEGSTQTVTDIPMLLSVGDVKDELEIVSGLLTHKCGIYIFTGEENFGSSSAYGTALYINAFANTIKADKTVQPMCTHFATGAGTSTQPEGTCFFNASGHFYFRTTESASDFKEWLAGQYAAGTPVLIVFARTEATQTTEQATPHSLHSYAGTTVVDVSAEVSPITLAAEYAASQSSASNSDSPTHDGGEN